MPDRSPGRTQLRLMPDSGVFPLWLDDGGLVPRYAREVLGLDEDLVEQLTTWGQEADYVVLPPGWEERGRDLYRRLSDALPGYEVVFDPH